jgi:hypothetical protein
MGVVEEAMPSCGWLQTRGVLSDQCGSGRIQVIGSSLDAGIPLKQAQCTNEV